MKKKMYRNRIIALLLAAVTFALAGCGAGQSGEKRVPVDVVLDHVIDLGTFDALEFEEVNKYLATKYDFRDSGCTAAATTVGNGDTIVGRTLDFYISDKPAYVCRTKVPGSYETIGVGYSSMSGESFATVQEKGILENNRKVLPFLCTDVLNEKGLYCEINMRNGEFYPDGTDKFGCEGTNPDADIRACVITVPRLVCENCATVKEAVEYLKTIDLYTPKKPGFAWNFCYLLADATGDYGLVEIAENEISFLDKQHVQTNFYVTKKFADKEEYKCGIGRYDVVMNGIKDVQSEEDMFNLLDQVTYYQSNFPDECKYDWRTEYVGVKPHWTTDYVLDEANRKEVLEEGRKTASTLKAMTREEIEAENHYWESALTTITNCNNGTMTIRFFEDNDRVYDMSF